MNLTNNELKLLISDVEWQCQSYSLKAAKRTLMLTCLGNADGWSLFSAALEARTKKDFIRKISKIKEEI